jgi:RteC protein
MLEFTKQLHDELLENLEGLDRSPDNEKIFACRRLELIHEAIKQLKEKLRAYKFISEQEEIQFFKTSMPQVLSLLIYYKEKIDLESFQEMTIPKLKFGFVNRTYSRTEKYIEDNIEFYKYYHTGKSDLDSYYFLRKNQLSQENLDLLSSVMDPSFGTIYSLKVATFLAYEKLGEELHANISDEQIVTPDSKLKKSDLKWTDPKIGIIELIYALREKGAFNNGKADLIQIKECFEKIFSISLGNIYRYFQDILTRKTGYTPYLDQLKERLRWKIDHIDDYQVN